MDSQGNLYGTTDDAVFEIVKGSGTITTLATLQGGFEALALDGSGNLWGASSSGGAEGAGFVFEISACSIAAGTPTLTAEASFADNSYGAAPGPRGNIAFDSEGNLYGATEFGGDSTSGTVYEITASSIASGSPTITTLATFDDGADGGVPEGGVIVDSNGDVLGTTSIGGDYQGDSGDGTIFEITAGSIADGSPNLTILAQFNSQDSGSEPADCLVMDASGNLYGTTQFGGDTGNGTIFELPKGSGTIDSLYSFTGWYDGASPSTSLVVDAGGNLYGSTDQDSDQPGGIYGDGDIFELQKGATSLTTLYSFTGGTDGYCNSSVVMDAQGILYGGSAFGGASRVGSVFEIPSNIRGQLAFVQQPTAAITGEVISPPVTVDVEDNNGNLLTGDNSTVTLSVATGTPGALDGTLSVAAVNGVASFSNISFSSVGAYTLLATDSSVSITGATSSSDFITGPPAQLVIDQGPSQTIVGAPIAPAVTVEVEDQFGNVVTTDSSNVTVALATAPVGGALGGPLTVAAVSGVATFSELWINQSGTYSLDATDGTLTPATSNSFTVTGSYRMSLLAVSDGPNESEPDGTPIFDSNGNLYDTTWSGGTKGLGSFFEIAKGSNTITTLASFDFTDGAEPLGGLVADANGDFFGVTNEGGEYNDGVVFEIAAGSETISALATFDGARPVSGLIIDGNGNLYGETGQGGAFGPATIFEVVKNSGVITTLATFNGSTGYPMGPSIVMDGAGNIFGVSASGGETGYGSVFELPKGSSEITTLATFNSELGYADGQLVMDGDGNIFGSAAGGVRSIIFELPKETAGYGAISVYAMLSATSTSLFPMVIDGHDDIFGIGVSSIINMGTDSTLFEVVGGSGMVESLASFFGVNGYEADGLVMDARGDLIGVDAYGGNNSFNIDSDPGYGDVFELQAPHLAFLQQPTDAAPGSAITPPVEVAVENPFGSIITSDDSTITITLSSGPGALGGIVTATATNGIATFSDLTLSTSGVCTLQAQYDPSSTITAISNNFAVGAPQVSNVTVDATAWSSTFVSYLSTLNSANVNGYSIPVGSSAQLAPLPWKNLNQINITFTQNVTVSESALQLVGVNVATYAFSGFSYNSSTDTATWTLTAPIGDDKLLIDLNGASVTNSGGIELDGDWADGVSIFPSGDGSPGSNFLFSFDVLPGDVN
jgi:uncharacterized repeat protein (TIGR03803 family)